MKKSISLILFVSQLILLAPCQANENGVVSHTPKGPPHIWTREEMLLAQPMPMSGEERKFVFSHKSVQKLHKWSDNDFKKYVSSPIGRRILFDEGNKWIRLRCVLKAQVKFARDFIEGKSKKPKPLPYKQESDGDSSNNTDISSNQPNGPGSTAPGASAGYPGEDGLGDTPAMNLRQNMSPEEKFLKNKSVLTDTNSKTIFKKLKVLRTDISKYCKQYDALINSAKAEGKNKSLENAMASVIWE